MSIQGQRIDYGTLNALMAPVAISQHPCPLSSSCVVFPKSFPLIFYTCLSIYSGNLLEGARFLKEGTLLSEAKLSWQRVP